jgi:hypothetical protein
MGPLLQDYLVDVRRYEALQADKANNQPTLAAHYGKILHKIPGGCLRTAKQLILRGQNPIIASPTVVAQTTSKFTLIAPPEHDRTALHQLCTECNNINSTPFIPISKVKHRIQSLPAGAAPGRSGTRVSHIQACLRVPGGAKAWHQWAIIWARGKVPHTAIQVWVQPLLIPIPKNS